MHSCNYVLRGAQGRKNAFILEDQSVRRRRGGFLDRGEKTGSGARDHVTGVCERGDRVRLRGALRSRATRGRLVMVVTVQSTQCRGLFFPLLQIL